MAYTPNNPNGQALKSNSSPVVLSTEQEAKLDLLSTKDKQDLLLAELQLKADLTETQPVSVVGTVLVSGPLTDTQIRATPLPISGTVSTGLVQPITDTQIRATPLAVSLSSVPSHPVTNAGIFPVQATLSAETTKVIGTVNIAGTIPVSGTFFQATQPVSIVSLPLPVGAATETTLANLNSKIVSVNTESVVITSSVLPTGASTSTLQSEGNTSLSNIDTKLPNGLTVTAGRLQVELPSGGTGLTDTELRATPVPVSLEETVISNTVSVSGPLTNTELRATALPVSGTITANAGTNLNTSLLALEETQNIIKESLEIITTAVYIDDTGIMVHGIGIMGTDGVKPQLVKTDANGELQVDVLSLPSLGNVTVVQPTGSNLHVAIDSSSLPTGASTESTLSSINTKIPSLGQAVMTASQPVVIASNQSTIPVSISPASVLFKGRACTFRTPGRAGTTGQNLLSIHNATGSAISLVISKITIDLYQTVIKAITVAPPIIRMWKVTVLPTNGTTLTKTKIGGTTTSNTSVTVLGDASADGTGSATTLTTTRPAGAFISQEYAPRYVTAAGYEVSDRIEFFDDTEVVLDPLQGVVVFLDYSLATQNPTTDMWIAGVEWQEKTV